MGECELCGKEIDISGFYGKVMVDIYDEFTSYHNVGEEYSICSGCYGNLKAILFWWSKDKSFKIERKKRKKK